MFIILFFKTLFLSLNSNPLKIMKFKSILFLFISAIFIIPCLSVAQTDSEKIVEQKIQAHNEGFLVSADGIELFSQIELPKFYSNRDFKLAWTDERPVKGQHRYTRMYGACAPSHSA